MNTCNVPSETDTCTLVRKFPHMLTPMHPPSHTCLNFQSPGLDSSFFSARLLFSPSTIAAFHGCLFCGTCLVCLLLMEGVMEVWPEAWAGHEVIGAASPGSVVLGRAPDSVPWPSCAHSLIHLSICPHFPSKAAAEVKLQEYLNILCPPGQHRALGLPHPFAVSLSQE